MARVQADDIEIGAAHEVAVHSPTMRSLSTRWAGLLLVGLAAAVPAAGDDTGRSTGTLVEETELVATSADGLALAGTLFAPRGGRELPALVFGHGSGQEHRKLPGYRGLAAELARQGFAVLIWDKRGVGDSQGEYEETPDFEVAASDVVSWVRRVKELPQTDAAQIGLVGHSQAGWIVPKAATLSPDVAFVVVLCGGGVTLRDQMIYSRSIELADQGLPPAGVAGYQRFSREFFDYLATGEGYEQLAVDYAKARPQPWFKVFSDRGFGEQPPPPEILARPVFEHFRRAQYDPAADLRRIQAPFLAILAGRDRQLPTGVAAPALRQALADGGNQSFEVLVLADEDHALWERDPDSRPIMKRSMYEPMLAWLREITGDLGSP